MQTQPPLTMPLQAHGKTATLALAVGAYLCAADFIISRVLKVEPIIRGFLGFETAAFFYILMAAMFCLKTIGLVRFGNHDIVRDVREICGYDVLTALLGLGLYMFGQNVLPAKVLNYGFFAVLVLRLCWNFKTLDGRSVASWPVFGLIGLFNRHRNTREVVSDLHDYLVYVAICLSPVLGFALIHLSADEFATVMAGGAITFLLLQAPFFMMAKAPQEPPPQAATKPAAMPSAPSPMPSEQGSNGGAVDLNPEEQKLIQAYRGMATENQPKVLNAMVALQKAFDKHKPDQAPGD